MLVTLLFLDEHILIVRTDRMSLLIKNFKIM